MSPKGEQDVVRGDAEQVLPLEYPRGTGQVVAEGFFNDGRPDTVFCARGGGAEVPTVHGQVAVHPVKVIAESYPEGAVAEVCECAAHRPGAA